VSGGEGVEEAELHISLGDLFGVIQRRLWIILVVVAVLTGATVGFSLLQTPMYDASIKILVGQERGLTQAPAEVMGLQQLTKTMAEGVGSRPVAEGVIEQLNLSMAPEDLLKNLEVKQVRDTQFIQADYRDASPERAQQVANAVGEVFSEQVSEVSTSGSAITASVWEQAAVPDEPASPNPVRNGVIALLVGLMLGMGLAFALEQLDGRWRSPQEAEQISGVPTFGVIPEFEFKRVTGKQKVRS